MAQSAQESLNGTRPAVGILADQPLDSDHDDLLGYGAFADALAELIDHPDTKTPLTIAISGPWGAGKTTLAKLVESRLKAWPRQGGELSHITCWFNAWMHDDAPRLGSAFAAVVAKEADEQRSTIRRLLRPLPSTLLSSDGRRHRLIYLALTTLSVVALAALLPLDRLPVLSILLHPETLGKIHDRYFTKVVLLLLVAAPAAFVAWAKIGSSARMIAGFAKDSEKGAGTGSVQEVTDQLGTLLQQAMNEKRQTKDDKRRFVIFVDNLERCKPPRAVEVCEVANQLLSHPGVVTVLVADMASVARCADIKYASLEGRHPVTETPQAGRGNVGETYGQQYLEKIVQIQFDLPVLSASSLQILMDNPSEHETSQPQSGAPESQHISTQEPTPGRKGQILDTASKRGWKTVFWLSVLVLIPGLRLSPPNSGGGAIFSYALTISIIALFALFLIRSAILTLRYSRRLMARRNKEMIDEQLERDGGVTDSNSERLVKIRKTNPGLINQRFTRYRNDELLRQADAALLPFLPTLPPLPRTTKRLVNLLRVLLIVAERRKLLGGAPEMTIQHLAKWVTLICGWPQLGSILRAVPERMVDLEDTADLEELTGRLRELDYGQPVTKDLVHLLRFPVKLAPVMPRLVAYEPATEGANGDGPLTISTAAQASSDRVWGDGLPRQGAVKNGSAEH